MRGIEVPRARSSKKWEIGTVPDCDFDIRGLRRRAISRARAFGEIARLRLAVKWDPPFTPRSGISPRSDLTRAKHGSHPPDRADLVEKGPWEIRTVPKS